MTRNDDVTIKLTVEEAEQLLSVVDVNITIVSEFLANTDKKDTPSARLMFDMLTKYKAIKEVVQASLAERKTIQ